MKKKREKLIPPTTLLFEDSYQFETALSLEECVDILESIDNRHRLFKYWRRSVEVFPVDEDTFQIILNATTGHPLVWGVGYIGRWEKSTLVELKIGYEEKNFRSLMALETGIAILTGIGSVGLALSFQSWEVLVCPSVVISLLVLSILQTARMYKEKVIRFIGMKLKTSIIYPIAKDAKN